MTFDQATMREHLARCFSRQKLTPFPHSQMNAGILYPRYPYQHVEVFCNCEMPECLDNMIQCDGCEEWFHMSCVELEIPPPETEPWHCGTLCNACI